MPSPPPDFLPPDLARFWEAVRPADFLDVLLVAVALAGLLSWLKRRATRPLLTAAALAFIIYSLALWQQLYVTLWLFKVGLVVLLAAALVAYQEDLRRGFERLAAGSLLRSHIGTDDGSQAVALLTEAVFDFAGRNVGALLILPGREHLDRHLRGGWKLDAIPSLPLLQSIFDPSSPGHDGAAIISPQGRLARMGAHLPLSANQAAIAGRGTRHAAALGLVERSDALVVVVSEERGEVCLGRDGRLDHVTAPADLAAVLTERFALHRPTARRSAIRLRDPEVKIAAVFASVLLWLAIAAPTDPVQRTFTARVEMARVPEGWTLETPLPPSVDVTLAGSERLFDGLNTEALRLEFNMADLQPGVNQLPVTAATLNAPEGLRVAQFSTESVFVQAHAPDAGQPTE